MHRAVLASILAVGLAACSKKSPAETRGVDVATIKADAVNALVPEPLRAKLVFATTKIDETALGKTRTYTMASPRGWYPKTMIAWVDSPPADDVGGSGAQSSVSVIARPIENTNWAASAELREFYPPSSATAKIIKDEIKPDRRTRVVDTGTSIEIVTSWTEPGATNYVTCDATLFAGYRAAAAAFEKACEAVNVSGLH